MNNIKIEPMSIFDSGDVNKLRMVLHEMAVGEERASLYGLVLKICFVLSSFSAVRWIIYKIHPHFAFNNLVAKNNGRVVGLAWLQGTTNKAVMLAGIMVTKEFQEQGVGRLLDKCREEVARKLGVKRLEMYIDGNNNKSNDWHLGQGYSVIRTYLGKKL